MKQVNLIGKKIDYLTVISNTDNREAGFYVWLCLCGCGNELDISSSSLTADRYKSCGCLKRKMNVDVNKKLHMIDHTCIEFIEKRLYLN